jgi:ribosomal protein L11 methylase PrmA
MTSGLYAKLVERNLLIPHDEIDDLSDFQNVTDTCDLYRIIQPERVPFISYPYEWSFSQLKDAARATLEIQRIALRHGMSLKDSSAYNIQFRNGRPVFIDTLSFEIYREDEPWVAYKQFCEHFFAPLTLASYTDVRLTQLLRVYLDGIPLDLAVRLLPTRTKWRPSLLMHLHLHAASQRRHADDSGKKAASATRKTARVSKAALGGIIDNLDGAVKKLTWEAGGTEWGEYYNGTNYSGAAFEHKRKLVREFTEQMLPRPTTVWDLGANTGVFSEIAASLGAEVVAFDIDPAAVERGYLATRATNRERLLPLILDLTNPSPDLGWAHRERMSLVERGPVDAVFALALIHHLAISNNLPLDYIASFFAEIGRWLIIEFVPKSDSQVRRLLASREDIFDGYTQNGFEQAFSSHFQIHRQESVRESDRTLYLMERKTSTSE